MASHPPIKQAGIHKGQPSKTSGKAITSLLFGLSSIVFAFLTGIVAIIFGIIALIDISKFNGRVQGKGLAITGIVLGSLGILWTIPLLMFALIAPAVGQVRAAAFRTQSMNNMRMICIAMHEYQSIYKSLPLASEHANSQLSWRVHLLPIVGENELYERFNLSEPWDSPHNMALLSEIPDMYANKQESLPPGHTCYLRPVSSANTAGRPADQALFQSGQPGPQIPEIKDGAANTIMLVEVDAKASVPWTKPDSDWSFNRANPLHDLGTLRRNVFLAGMADGSVQMISNSTSPDLVSAMMTPAGGEAMPAGIDLGPATQ